MLFSARQTLAAGARVLLSAGLLLGCASVSWAQADAPASVVSSVKQAFAQRLPDMPPVTSVRSSPIPGLFEVQAGSQLFYTDAKGEYLVDGHVVDMRTQRDLTEERLDEVNKIDFGALPFKDAVVWKNGSGKRKLVIFADPNCGYCKRLEKDLQQVKDVTVYTFMVGILGEDSKVKLNNIWCVKDRTQAYRDWMITGVEPVRAFGSCGNPGARNLALAQKFRVNGTPAMFFEDGTRLAAAAAANVVEQRLSRATAKVGG